MAKGRALGMGRVYGQAAVARDIEEGHAEGGEVKTYTLSLEELEKYRGKPNMPPRGRMGRVVTSK